MMPRVGRHISARGAGDEFVPLDGCEVLRTTERAVLVIFEVTTPTGHKDEVEVWVPRSVCHDGDDLTEGDKEIAVKRWFIEKNELPT